MTLCIHFTLLESLNLFLFWTVVVVCAVGTVTTTEKYKQIVKTRNNVWATD